MKISGIMPALVTPLNSDETLNVTALRTLIDYHKKQDADGFYICGATGEGLVLSVDTRKRLFEESVNAVGSEKQKIIHVTDMNFETTKRLAKYAEDVGADAISAIPPIYFGYDEDDIYNYYKEIAASVKIPLMLYYTPSANVQISTQLFKRLSEIDNITSVKWTMNNYYKMIEFVGAVGDKMQVINGPDEMLLCGLSAGASGGIGTTYNVMLPLYKKIYQCFKNADMATALKVQTEADKIISVLCKYSLISATKVTLEYMGFDVGYPTFPMKRYTKEEKKTIIKDLIDAGFKL